MAFDRPDYKALEVFIKKHKGEVRYLIIMDHDRFSRSLTEALIKIEELEERYNLKVLACKEATDVDTRDPKVFIQRAMDYLIANSELLRIRKRTMEGSLEAHLKGRYVGVSPYGYEKKTVAAIGDKVMLLPVEEKASHVQRIFELYLAGHPLFQVHKIVSKEGFKNKSHSAIKRILENCLYAGLIYIKADKYNPEKYVRGIHQPLVSEFDFWTVQEALGNIKPIKSQPKYHFPLRGLIKCRCGQNMTAGFSKGKKKSYLYYRCIHHNNKNYSGSELHENFERLLMQLSLSAKQQDRILDLAKAIVKKEVGDYTEILTARKKSMAEVNKKI